MSGLNDAPRRSRRADARKKNRRGGKRVRFSRPQRLTLLAALCCVVVCLAFFLVSSARLADQTRLMEEEQEAYERFGRRCRLQCYTRFSTLLVRNLRKGNDELLRILSDEAAAAFEKRKALARQKGEEAGTKLLLPMMLMLGVTLVMIMIPAYLGFSV